MSRITREDIQRIGDEATLTHFLQEKLNLSISEGATLEQIALPYSLEVFDIEQEIDELVYDLYELTEAEIELIEEESNQ
jgi:uncharacterized protein YpbB